MTAANIIAANRQVQIEQVSVAQASANADTVAAGSEIDARGWRSVAYTIQVATQSVDWTIFGANLADYSDEVAVQTEAPVAASAIASYAVAQAPYAYYRVKINSTVGGQHGTATISGIAKA